ncbi:MAG TPA: TraB/GumN family protein [Luteimonas sp.]|nr:TraB/GumN family protein [Luteimonas sp.]
MPLSGVLFRVSPPTPATGDPAAAGVPPAPSFLFGTIHFGSEAELGLDAASLATALASADTLVGEIDVDTVAGPALDHYRWLPPGQPLSTLVDADAWSMARHLLPDIAPETLERMKPWMVLALVEARGESLGEDTLDVRLQRMARARGMPLVQLETLEDQLRALDCVPPDAQALVLQERLKTPWVLREMSQRALAHYRGRDLGAWLDDVDRMPGLGDAARAIEQQARRCLVEDRNARWMPALLSLLSAGGRYVAVGAIHLPGEQGLLAALARAGYRIEAEPL